TVWPNRSKKSSSHCLPLPHLARKKSAADSARWGFHTELSTGCSEVRASQFIQRGRYTTQDVFNPSREKRWEFDVTCVSVSQTGNCLVPSLGRVRRKDVIRCEVPLLRTGYSRRPGSLSHLLPGRIVRRSLHRPHCSVSFMWPGLRRDVDPSDAVLDEVIYPRHAASPPLPPEVPEDIRKDFEEASLVLLLSSKASAALSRRLLQRILRERWGIKHES